MKVEPPKRTTAPGSGVVAGDALSTPAKSELRQVGGRSPLRPKRSISKTGGAQTPAQKDAEAAAAVAAAEERVSAKDRELEAL